MVIYKLFFVFLVYIFGNFECLVFFDVKYVGSDFKDIGITRDVLF